MVDARAVCVGQTRGDAVPYLAERLELDVCDVIALTERDDEAKRALCIADQVTSTVGVDSAIGLRCAELVAHCLHHSGGAALICDCCITQDEHTTCAPSKCASPCEGRVTCPQEAE